MNDFKYAVRQLAKRPGFTAVVVLTVAIGIGATTAIFSVVNALLLRQLPVVEPERLVNVQERTEEGRLSSSQSLAQYLEYHDRSEGIARLAAHHISDIMLNTGEVTSAELALDVSGNYFDVLGIQPARGRFFTADEARRPGASVAVVSYDLWQTELGGDPAVVGRTIVVNSQPLTVIGVAPRGFQGTFLGARPAVWLPLGLYERFHPERNLDAWAQSIWLQPFGRLSDGVTASQAEAGFTAIARQLAQDYEYWEGEAPVSVRLREFSGLPPSLRDAARGFVTLLLITAALVLVIAAVNVAGMLLARGAERGREMAIRLALGARRRRVMLQVLTESVTLALLGGVLGLVLATWLSDVLATVRPPGTGDFFRVDFGLDQRVLLFAVGVSVVTGVAFGALPAAFAAGHNLSDALKLAAASPRRQRVRVAMVVGQLALSLVLLTTAGLFVRTVQSALVTEHGFDPENVLAIELNLGLNGYDEARGRAFYDQLLERIRALPGAESAALARLVPLGLSWDQTRARVPGFDPPPGQSGVIVGSNVVTPGYFETLRMPLLEGREFSPRDREGEARAIIINETFARRFWPDESPVGRRIWYSGSDAEIVGVVPAGKYQSYAEEPTLVAYQPFDQAYGHEMMLHVRVRGSMATVMASIRNEIRAIDPNVAPIAVNTVENILGSSLFAQRLAAGLVGGFGLLGLALAAVGMFGLLAFMVAQRTRELGLRMALGARQGDVVRLVLRRGLTLVAIGSGAGLILALLATRLVRGLLVNVSPTDPVTIVAVVGLLMLVTLFAAWLPARRAARVHPMQALRYE